MKQDHTNPARKRKFIHTPQYPGGKVAFQQFIAENLQYPEDALRNRVEGVVFIEYEVNDLGKVVDVWVKKGIGSGCDEEAVRLIRLLEYEPVHNRGLRIKSKMKTRLMFHLPPSDPLEEMGPKAVRQNITIHYSTEPPAGENAPQTFTYTIKIG